MTIYPIRTSYLSYSTLLACAALVSCPAVSSPRLDEVIVTATRHKLELARVPLAVSLVGDEVIHLGRQELGLDESLVRVPGLFMQNRYNFAQDLRISVRGFGSRANFGIRGIKVFADGIPLTLPDGQSGTDDLDIGSAGRIEVIRGPAAALYGTAAGGVINVTTEEAPEEPFAESRVTIGEYGHRRYQFKTGGRANDFSYMVNAAYLEMDGYRDFSEVDHRLINSNFGYRLSDTSNISAIVNLVDSPTANDPGGITRAEAEADPTQAQTRNLSSNAGEKFNQQRLGLVYNNTIDDNHDLTVRGYSLWKDFQTFLPIGTHIPFVADDGVAEYQRNFYGGGARYTYSSGFAGLDNSLTLGVDADVQKDERRRHLNNAGIKGEKVFDQLEEAKSLGLYISDQLNVSDTVTVTLGGRFDKLDLSVADHYLENGDQSGTLEFDQFSPSAGVTWLATPKLNLYANYGTAFETPTFTELGTPAQELNVNLGGFANVSAQEAESFEVGARGNLSQSIYYDVALYAMNVDNEISNVVSIGNRAFFENADTDRTGVEAQVQASLRKDLKLTAAYTYSDFTFSDFDTEPAAVGQWLPGIPRHQFYGELDYRLAGNAYIIWDALYVGRFYADNVNRDKVDAYWVSNLRTGNDYQMGATVLSLFVGINNLFDESYFSNVRSNAFGGRAYEPAPVRHFYGGVKLRF